MDIALILEGEFEVVALLSPGTKVLKSCVPRAKGQLSRVKAKIARSRPTILAG